MRAVLVLVLAVVSCGPASSSTSTTPSTTRPPSTAAPMESRSTPAPDPEDDQRAAERLEMVERQIAGRGVVDPVVLEAMRSVPRHRFVPEDMRDLAYRDHPLPIGHGQTISQPLIVAMMSEALEVEPGDRVLEIGTGSGYQAAVLAAMGLEVYTIEIVPELADRAAAALNALNYDVTVETADGYHGWEEHAPFDGIIVTAAPDHVPQPLVAQLDSDGVMVIPIGPIGAVQTLWKFRLDTTGELVAESLGPVMFVPFTRAEQ